MRVAWCAAVVSANMITGVCADMGAGGACVDVYAGMRADMWANTCPDYRYLLTSININKYL